MFLLSCHLLVLLTFLSVASPPTNLMAVQEGASSVRVSWNPPSPLGDTTGYRIYYNGHIDEVSSREKLLTGFPGVGQYTIFIIGTSQHFFSKGSDFQTITLISGKSYNMCIITFMFIIQ